MDIPQALILSLVEGLTEFLPVSSTGHLVLTSDILNIPQTEFVKSFEVIIQLGAILAVVALYASQILLNRALWVKLVISFIPTAILGLIFYNIIKTYLIGNTSITLAALFLGGIVFLLFETTRVKSLESRDVGSDIETVTIPQAFFIGLFQSISMVPGVSRAAATILGGMFLGLNRKTAVEYSFLLAIPTMTAAAGLDLYKSSFSFSSEEYQLLGIGLLGSFLTAIIAIKFFLSYIQNHTFIPFGIYRVILALVFYLFLLS